MIIVVILCWIRAAHGEEFPKEVIRIRISKKGRQYNDQTKIDIILHIKLKI